MKMRRLAWLWNLLPLFIIITIGCLDFALLLRHKSPYLSDSYFYQHIVWQLQGKSFDQAYALVLARDSFSGADAITQNIFLNPDMYHRAYGFFVKRPLYPLLAYGIQTVGAGEYLGLLFPQLAGFIGSIICMFLVFRRGLGKLWAILGTALFLGFYPFLDWSTYFLTDTMGYFLWLAELILAWQYLKTGKMAKLILFSLVLAISLANREQNMLFVLAVVFFFVLVRPGKKDSARIRLLFFSSIALSLTLALAIQYFHLPNIVDTVIYTENNYGLTHQSFSLSETLGFWGKSILAAHLGAFSDLLRHRWWLTLTILGLAGTMKFLLTKKTNTMFDRLILASGWASYTAILFYPVLSYRYIYPFIFMLLYMSLHLIRKFTT